MGVALGFLLNVLLAVKRLGDHFEPSSSEFSSAVFNFNATQERTAE